MKNNISKFLTFDFVWKSGGLSAIAFGIIFPVISYKVKNNKTLFTFSIDVISISIILSIVVGVTLCIIYTVHNNKNKDTKLENLYYGTCTEEELQQAIEDSD